MKIRKLIKAGDTGKRIMGQIDGFERLRMLSMEGKEQQLIMGDIEISKMRQTKHHREIRNGIVREIKTDKGGQA